MRAGEGRSELPTLDGRGGISDVDDLERILERAGDASGEREPVRPEGRSGRVLPQRPVRVDDRDARAIHRQPAQSWWKISSAVMRFPSASVIVVMMPSNASPQRVLTSVPSIRPKTVVHVRVVLAVVDDVGAATEAGVVAEAGVADRLHHVRPRIGVDAVVVGGALGVDDERQEAARHRPGQRLAARVEHLVVPEELALRRRDLGDDVAEVVAPALVGRLGAMDREGRAGVGLGLDVVPDIGAPTEPAHVAHARLPDLVREVRPDRLVAPVVLGLGPREESQVEECPFHANLPLSLDPST